MGYIPAAWSSFSVAIDKLGCRSDLDVEFGYGNHVWITNKPHGRQVLKARRRPIDISGTRSKSESVVTRPDSQIIGRRHGTAQINTNVPIEGSRNEFYFLFCGGAIVPRNFLIQITLGRVSKNGIGHAGSSSSSCHGRVRHPSSFKATALQILTSGL